MKTLRLAVLVSGSGSNLQAIMESCSSKKINAEVSVVISDKPGAFGLERARKSGIKAAVVDSKDFKAREAHEEAVSKIIDEAKVDLICLAGYMRVLTPFFIKKYKGKLLNIHPALLPSFGGAHGQRDAFEYGVKVSGCTVHFVDEGVDTGPIIAQTAVPVLEDDTVETLSKRILVEEHKIYSKVIGLFADQRVKVNGRKVQIKAN